jgi:hypothetical protein
MTEEKSSYAVCVKLNPKQHSILKETSKTPGESIPEI